MAKKPVTKTAEEEPTYKRVSYDILESDRKALALAALENDTKQNALVRAMFELFVTDSDVQKRVIEIAVK